MCLLEKVLSTKDLNNHINISFHTDQMDWTSFHDLEDIEGFSRWLNFTTGDLVQMVSVARTLEGREVQLIRIMDPSTPGPKKKIWIEGGEASWKKEKSNICIVCFIDLNPSGANYYLTFNSYIIIYLVFVFIVPMYIISPGIHAREWISPAVTTYLMHQVAMSPEWKDILKVTEWYFVPVANPDGYQYSFSSPRAR